MDILPPTPENIQRAADALRSGEVIAYPTETVYGYGVDPLNESALARLYSIKQRGEEIPMLLIVSSLDQLRHVVSIMTVNAAHYAEAFWPGPLSMLFPASGRLPAALRGRSGKVCVRRTSSKVATALCNAFAGAIVSTSANMTGQAPALSPSEVPGDGIALCLDGGVLAAGPVSTVFDPDTDEIIREGVITREQLGTVRRVHG